MTLETALESQQTTARNYLGILYAGTVHFSGFPGIAYDFRTFMGPTSRILRFCTPNASTVCLLGYRSSMVVQSIDFPYMGSFINSKNQVHHLAQAHEIIDHHALESYKSNQSLLHDEGAPGGAFQFHCRCSKQVQTAAQFIRYCAVFVMPRGMGAAAFCFPVHDNWLQQRYDPKRDKKNWR